MKLKKAFINHFRLQQFFNLLQRSPSLYLQEQKAGDEAMRRIYFESRADWGATKVMATT